MWQHRRRALPADGSESDFSVRSHVVVQKYLHDLDAWNALDVATQGAGQRSMDMVTS